MYVDKAFRRTVSLGLDTLRFYRAVFIITAQFCSLDIDNPAPAYLFAARHFFV